MPRRTLRKFVEELGPDLSWAMLIMLALFYVKLIREKHVPTQNESESFESVGQISHIAH